MGHWFDWSTDISKMWPFKKSKPADRSPPPGALWGVPEEEYEKWPSEEEIAKMPRDQQFINRWTKEDVQTFPPVLEPDSFRSEIFLIYLDDGHVKIFF